MEIKIPGTGKCQDETVLNLAESRFAAIALNGCAMGIALWYLRMELRMRLFVEHKHRIYLWRLGWGHNSTYQQYLCLQFKRTQLKKSQDLKLRTRLLVDQIIEVGNLSSNISILCIGCRNSAEIDYFKSKGLSNVVGIDLFSEDPNILVMDMHQMTFPDSCFDMIYSSHSLEHAHDVLGVVRQIVRVACPGALVALEVPVQYGPRGADLHDFGGLKNLHAIWGSHIAQILWSEEQQPNSLRNDSGTAIVRTIFSLQKKGESSAGEVRC